MTTAPKEKKPFQLFNLPLPVFGIITLVTIAATYLGVLPAGMTGCFLFRIVLGTILAGSATILRLSRVTSEAAPSSVSLARRCWYTSGSFRPPKPWTEKQSTT